MTGRNNFRDCADDVYNCSDMTECKPDSEALIFSRQPLAALADSAYSASCSLLQPFTFPGVPDYVFAPNKTYTYAMAVRKADPEYSSWFSGN